MAVDYLLGNFVVAVTFVAFALTAVVAAVADSEENQILIGSVPSDFLVDEATVAVADPAIETLLVDILVQYKKEPLLELKSKNFFDNRTADFYCANVFFLNREWTLTKLTGWAAGGPP